VTHRGMAGNAYAGLKPKCTVTPPTLDDHWSEVRDDADPDWRDLIDLLMQHSWPTPTVGL
jgi:hypothetical protein